MNQGRNQPPLSEIERADRRLRTPRSAALAGLIFAGLFGICLALIATAFPEGVASSAPEEITRQKDALRLSLGLLPFSGIAFIWFIGVIRDLLGDFEDQFFSTVFVSSGLLFIAMMFIAGALAGGILAAELAGAQSGGSDVATTFGRLVMYQVTHNYAVRMAGVFMLSLGTIWFRTGLMPRWLALVTLITAVVLILIFTQSFIISMMFPSWVALISIYILVRNRRGLPEPAEAQEP